VRDGDGNVGGGSGGEPVRTVVIVAPET